ncbi:hypothetical protein ACFV1N_25385 [Streptosporangium canum]|uniref:hypothetical protein n=1 Tax=Streptosporangium canum TaxID=324952 RepID=UPI00369C9CB7
MIRYMNATLVKNFAAEVARYLPDTFEVQTYPQRWEQAAVVLVNGEERIALLHRTRGECCNDKITFMGLRLSADLSDPACLSHERGTYTTVALTRPPKAVAAQLGRNLLPYYRPQLAAQKTAEAHRAARRVARKTEAEQITSLLPGSEYTPTNSQSHYDSELIRFSRPDGAKGTLAVYANRSGLSYTLNFGPDAAFRDDLIALLDRHYGTPS